MKRIFSLVFILSLSVALSGCGGSGGSSSGPVVDSGSGSSGGSSGSSGGSSGTLGSVSVDNAGSAAARDAQPGGNFLNVANFPSDQVFAGCSGTDCIPALTDPTFVGAEDSGAGYLSDSDIVLGVVLNGEAKAYPHNIGWWHEIVNDQVGGQPIVVSLCPLTGTGMVFDGEGEEGVRIELGVSGLLFNNNLIMYDRRDNETLYPQMIFKGVRGTFTGQELKMLPVVETTWGYWKELYPHTQVISGNTGIYASSSYRIYPYIDGGADYRLNDAFIIFPNSPSFGQNQTSQFFRAKELTLGVRFGEIAKAYPFPAMGEAAVISDTVADNDIVVAYYRNEGLALSYSRKIKDQGEDRTLTFDRLNASSWPYPFLMKDRETGSSWNLKGEAIDGALKGRQLTQIPAHNAFWFAWSTFWQNTGVY